MKPVSFMMLYTENHVEIFNHWKDVEMDFFLLLFKMMIKYLQYIFICI